MFEGYEVESMQNCLDYEKPGRNVLILNSNMENSTTNAKRSIIEDSAITNAGFALSGGIKVKITVGSFRDKREKEEVTAT